VSSASRAPVRKHFAALLQAALVGTGKPAQAVYDHLVGDFRDAGVVVVVASGPILRQRASLGECWQSTVRLNVYLFVRYADPLTGWTEAQAEDALDACESAIADVVLENSTAPGYWERCTYAEDELTDLGSVSDGGVNYRRELIPVELEIFG